MSKVEVLIYVLGKVTLGYVSKGLCFRYVSLAWVELIASVCN